MAARVCLRRHRRAPPGRAVAAVFLALLLSASFLTVQAHPESKDSGTSAQSTHEAVGHALDSVGGHFIENRGQVADSVRYYSRGNPSVGFRDDGVMFVIRESGSGERRDASRGSIDYSTAIDEATKANSFAYMLRFEGANKAEPIGIDRLSFNSNFFIGREPGAWRTRVPNYRAIIYENLYDRIDLIYRLNAEGVKYEFYVHPGADPSSIRMRYESVDSIGVDSTNLFIRTPLGNITDTIPFSHQDGTSVECAFMILDSLTAGIDCGSWDHSGSLVIDPLVYSTFLGGDYEDAGTALARDNYGNVVVTGETYSAGFPTTPGANDTTFGGGYDGFVVKLASDGTSLLFASFLGGSEEDIGRGVAVDSRGDVYVSGETASADFPVTPGSFDTTFNSTGGFADGFLAKLTSSGSMLVYATFIGGQSIHVFSAAVDGSGNAYLTGESGGYDFPVTPGALNTSLPGDLSPYILKLSANGSNVVYGTFIGGTGGGRGTSIAVDQAGNAYVTGYTVAPDFPVTAGAFDQTYDLRDGFVVKLNDTGDKLLYSTFLGGTGLEYGNSVAVDFEGNAYLTGETNSADFPTTPGAYNVTLSGISDAYLTKLNANGSALTYSTYLGGTESALGTSIAVDYLGNAWVTGWTDSTDFPTTSDAFQGTFGGGTPIGDSFLAKLNARGDSLLYSTFLGGSGIERGWGVSTDLAGNAYAAGLTASSDFPVSPGSFDTSYNGGIDVFVVKLNPADSTDLPDLAITPLDVILNPSGPITVGTQLNVAALVRNAGNQNATSVIVSFHDGPPSGSNQIGSDQSIPWIRSYGGVGFASVIWVAGPPGTHVICVVADPDNRIVEINEDNNQACAPIEVLIPPIPDLVVSSGDIILSPASPYLENSSVDIDVTIHNIGGNASGGTFARIHDGMPPSPQIGTDQPLPPIGIGGAENVSALWNASPSGNHMLCVVADPDNLVAEINESNNLACVSVLVQPLPPTRPDYVPTQAQPPPPIKVALSSPVFLSVVVHNQGNATAKEDAALAFFNETSPTIPFSMFSVTPIDPGGDSPTFTAAWTSPAVPGTYLVSVDVDCENNVSEWDETNNAYTWTTEVVSGPVTSFVIGYPNYTSPAMVTYVKSTSPLSLFVLDKGGSGINHTRYRIDNVTWLDYSSSFFLSGDGDHFAEYYSEDKVGNVESINSRVLRVDDTPPVTAISIGVPSYVNGSVYITSLTPIRFSATDAGVSSNSTFYRLWGTLWSKWEGYSPSDFILIHGDGTWYAEFLSYDYLGNVESVQNQTIILDDTPPATTIHQSDEQATPATVFTLTATDSGCGVDVTVYRVDGGGPIEYAGGFTLSPGVHDIYYHAGDHLGNVEAEKHMQVTIEGPQPLPIEVAVNYKPIVALVFAIILLVAGVWSSRRRPWKGGKDRMAVVKTFSIFSLPFILAETLTGILSFITGELRIPPAVGVGTAVDLIILMAGLGVAILRALKASQSKAEILDEPRDR